MWGRRCVSVNKWAVGRGGEVGDSSEVEAGKARRDSVRGAVCRVMRKGRPGADQKPSSDTADRPRKKLSFREPEIMGYYMQMKQGVASRLSRKGKGEKPGKAAEAPEDSQVLGEALDEEELEVGPTRL